MLNNILSVLRISESHSENSGCMNVTHSVSLRVIIPDHLSNHVKVVEEGVWACWKESKVNSLQGWNRRLRGTMKLEIC